MPPEAVVAAAIDTLSTLLIPEIQFSDPSLLGIGTQFDQFLKSESDGQLIQKEIAECWGLIDEIYGKNDIDTANRIKRAYVFSAALTQNNLPNPKTGKDKTHRKNETRNDKPLPTFIHQTRMLTRALKLGDGRTLDPQVAEAILMHDLVEDVSYTGAVGSNLQGNKLLELIRSEFSKSPTLPDLIEMVTKYDESDPALNKIIRESDVYKAMKTKVMLNATELQEDKADKDVIKAISSVYRILQIAHERYGHDQSAYLRAVTSAIHMKGLDIADNYGSPGTSYGGHLRAHLMGAVLRIMNSPVSDMIMSGLASELENDPIYPQMSYTQLKQNQNMMLNSGAFNAINEALAKEFGEHVRAEPSFPIPFPDEDSDNSRTARFAAPQIIIRLPKEQYDRLLSSKDSLLQHPTLAQHLPGKVELNEFSGILSEAIKANGRPNRQYELIDRSRSKESDNVMLTVRIMTNEPNLADVPYGEYPLNCPERAFFELPKPDTAVPDAILRFEMLMFEPNKLHQFAEG